MSLPCTFFFKYSEILVENCRFNLPHLCLVPPLGVTLLEYRWDSGNRN